MAVCGCTILISLRASFGGRRPAPTRSAPSASSDDGDLVVSPVAEHGEPAGDAFLAIQKVARLTSDMPVHGTPPTPRAGPRRGPRLRACWTVLEVGERREPADRRIRGRRAPPGSTITGMAFERITVDPNRMGGV